MRTDVCIHSTFGLFHMRLLYCCFRHALGSFWSASKLQLDTGLHVRFTERGYYGCFRVLEQ